MLFLYLLLIHACQAKVDLPLSRSEVDLNLLFVYLPPLNLVTSKNKSLITMHGQCETSKLCT